MTLRINVGLYDEAHFTSTEIELSHMPSKHLAKVKQYQRTSYEVIIINCSKIPIIHKELSSFLEQYIIID